MPTIIGVPSGDFPANVSAGTLITRGVGGLGSATTVTAGHHGLLGRSNFLEF